MLQGKLEEILKQVADTENITNYEICPHKDAIKVYGFFNESYTGEVINKDTNLKIQTYVKIATWYKRKVIPETYSNEYHFYSKILPELDKFQIEKGVGNPFNNIPRFYCGDNKEDNQYIALENLKIKNYDMLDKSKKMSEEDLKSIFEIFGKFHALSFAFKDHNEKRFLELTKSLNDMYENWSREVSAPFHEACDSVKEIDINIYKKLEPIKKNVNKYFIKAATYNGKYSGLIHGDCWSTNMMFKYLENGQIEDLKLIDFQLCRDSTPIHDLSYFFYSEASKGDFMKLDEYLEWYHKSFSAFAKELGSDPEKLLPLNELKSEWKKYSFLGIYGAIMLWQYRETIETSDDNVEEKFPNSDNTADFSNIFINNIYDILVHAIEYGIIDYILTR